ncbi:MAG: hydrogenase maturation protease [Planctomyces sp.]|nr:hydrogenase maturation protease [Planctomyces sp.]
MSSRGGILIVGVGSFHGDDRVGWYVARRLIETGIESAEVRVRTAQVPLDLMNWIGDFETLHVVDACASDFAGPCWRRIDCSDTAEGTGADNSLRIVTRHASGTHGWSLPDVLDLARRLGQLPSRVVVWAVESSQFEPGTEIANRVVDAANEVIESLSTEVRASLIAQQGVLECMKSPS